MKRSTLVLIALLALLAWAFSSCAPRFKQSGSYQPLPAEEGLRPDPALPAAGKVIGISDGDTLTVLDSHQQRQRIRLQGIDAPEKKQAYGQSCKTGLSALAAGQTAQLSAYKRDQYGRIIAKVTVNGKDVALEQIRAGCGWHYKAFAREQSREDRAAYAAAEATARTAHLGLWAEKSPLAPWDYRRKHR